MTHPLSEARTTGLKRVLGSLLRDNSAASAAIFAVTLSGLVGLVGMGVETGLWFSERREYQTAADAGAIAGALQMAKQMTAGSSASLDTSETGAAWKEAIRNGASTFAAASSVQQLSSPTRAHVEVVEHPVPLLSALAMSALTINAVAEASVETLGSPCVIALTTSGTAINIQGSATVNAPNCIFSSKSTSTGTTTSNATQNAASVTISGGSNTNVDVAQIYSGGTIIQGGTPDVEAPMSSSGSTASDPFSSVPNPANYQNSAGCQGVPASGALPTGLPPLCKNSGGGAGSQIGAVGLSGSSNTWTISGTVYIADGDFSIGSGATLTGTGTVVLLGTQTSKIGRFNLDPNSHVNITAPDLSSSSSYKGIVFYQDPDAPATTNANTTNNIGGSNTTITGAIYVPAETLNFGGGGNTSCTLLVAKVINFTGNSTYNLDTSGCSNYVALPTYYTVALTQ